ncbi:tRNA wybutosine-synthesizing protein 5-like isoform X2 [Mizuhopecten yessoensis]|uniref:tRNA wybutosine-synthesizing protein 5-like isoform X2 n=1 Tax=Mizuhopecten yessoensis TaxID=6573 RepID=UPI000B45A013|nr:tRNA wybutosine-synthesizing protein 5-like isoform X2 [Mizuhopecten yessoensis]
MEDPFLLLVILTTLTCKHNIIGADLTKAPGHMKPFGYGRPMVEVEETFVTPDPETFWKNNVYALKPLKMKGAASISPAFSKWTDDYFLSLDMSNENTVTVETVKKESRQQKIVQMDFQRFVQEYNNSEIYMVNSVPQTICKDVVLPCPLQCQYLVEKGLVEALMWYSSGGTNSVVHTDSVDNINCLYRGKKEFILIDPSKYGDKVDLDHPEGSYSAVDVDSVDYTAYPGLAEVEYIHVSMEAGDCLYIPYRWIHQVRSYANNLAVNIWWNHHIAPEINLDLCNAQCDLDLTLDALEFRGFGEVTTVDGIRDHFETFLGVSSRVSFKRFQRALLGEDLDMLKERNAGDEHLLYLRQNWTQIQKVMMEMDSYLDRTLGVADDNQHDEL